MLAFPERCDPRRILEVNEGATELLAIDPRGVSTPSLSALPETKIEFHIQFFRVSVVIRFKLINIKHVLKRMKSLYKE